MKVRVVRRTETLITLGLLPVVALLHQRAMKIIITHTHLLCLLSIKSHANNFNKQDNTHTPFNKAQWETLD